MVKSDLTADGLQLDDERLAPLHAAFCGVFADGKRLRIMWFLRDGEHRVNDIAEHLGVTQHNVSQHLRLMRDRGALIARREGNAVFYRVANPKFLQGARLIREGLFKHAFLRRKNQLKLLNYLRCQAHRDVSIETLTSNIKSNPLKS